jgi:hypothetical protein
MVLLTDSAIFDSSEFALETGFVPTNGFEYWI